jgi:hypothetical protein
MASAEQTIISDVAATYERYLAAFIASDLDGINAVATVFRHFVQRFEDSCSDARGNADQIVGERHRSMARQ